MAGRCSAGLKIPVGLSQPGPEVPWRNRNRPSPEQLVYRLFIVVIAAVESGIMAFHRWSTIDENDNGADLGLLE